MLNWHLVRAQSSRTLPGIAISTANLVDEVVVLYRQDEIWSLPRPLFETAYLFARWHTTDAAMWHAVRWQPGVAAIVGGELPAIIEDYEVRAWQSFADDNGLVDREEIKRRMNEDTNSPFAPGSEVSFTFGKFEDRTGTYRGMDWPNVRIEIMMLGHPVIVRVPLSRVFMLDQTVPEHYMRQQRSRARRDRADA